MPATGNAHHGEESAMEKATRRRTIGSWLLATTIAGTVSLTYAPGLAGERAAFVRTIDDVFASTAARIPSFGGLWVDESADVLYVWITNSRMTDALGARAIVAAALGDASLAAERVVPLLGRYSFAQLHRWHTRITARVLGMTGVTSTDVDDRRNRIAIGVDDLRLTPLIRARMNAMNVPLDAVVIERGEGDSPMGSLQATVRPLAGGTQITGAGKICTLGFTATRGNVNGIVTNSHCTASRTGVSGSSYYQATSSTSNKVGVESVDPSLYANGSKPCPHGRVCRYSDAAFIAFSSGVSYLKGRVARPAANNTTSWDQSGAYRIVAEESPVVGRTVTKIGRTTGLTEASVSRTCINVGVTDTNITMLCQAQASLGSQPGDSGSTVLRVIHSPAAYDARLTGILWGSSTFSPIANIQFTDTELGPVNPCASGFTC
jgi:hypothetical protein